MYGKFSKSQLQIQGVLREYEQAIRLGAWKHAANIYNANMDLHEDFDRADLNLHQRGGVNDSR